MGREKLSSSQEDYLEAIYWTIADKQGVRAKDIAQRLGVSNASVTGALRSLAKKGLINYAPYDVITLTEKGEEAAREVAWRHETLRDFFVKVLLVDQDTADIAACKMEHGIPRKIIDRFIHFIHFMERCPLGGERLKEDFKKHLECRTGKVECKACKADTGALKARD